MAKYNSVKAGVQRGSIEKVWNLIKEEGKPITPSKIAQKVNLQMSTVRSCLDFLRDFEKIEIILLSIRLI